MHTSATPLTRPGIVRRLWWRSGQGPRLAVAGLSVITTVAATGAVTFGGDAFPVARGSSGLEQSARGGDSVEATVREVSEVDSFEGVEPDTGLPFRARVAGVRRDTDCWLAESRAAARELLLGKEVRLLVRRDGTSGGDQVVVDVVLPDGRDYARTVVRDGAAPADPSSREELAPVEAAARQDRRGRWAAGCEVVETPVSSAPSSTAPSTSTTTTTVPVTTTEASPQPSSSPPSPTSSSQADGPRPAALAGTRCDREGERGTTIAGRELVCTRNDKGELRWRRAK
ncbi:hypothetical protein GCM10011609_26020 [Lentzea pudingi]|uniref:Endonuclease YncB, thermonuclease family n=1 Tax=Lentzea pudingi TaxID=1789439 RepID=A0ABQ2HPS4_9PSEU|nr:hypothetical protein [Lentzea pudingi]GGM88081.1 hypothetical protein GCM10011609_26020 [Lentzea pudingi]